MQPASDTPAFIADLLRPAAFPHPADDIQLRETHISWVVLAGGFAYKVKKPVNLGFVGTANDGFARRTGRDVVLVNSDVVVFEGWLDGLRSALTTRPRVASVTASTNNGSLATVSW